MASLIKSILAFSALHAIALAQGSISTSDDQWLKGGAIWRVQAYDSYPAGEQCTGTLVNDIWGTGPSGCVQPIAGSIGAGCYIAQTSDNSTCTVVTYWNEENNCSSSNEAVKLEFTGAPSLHATSYDALSLAVVC